VAGHQPPDSALATLDEALDRVWDERPPRASAGAGNGYLRGTVTVPLGYRTG
jgi:hypothetical protein